MKAPRRTAPALPRFHVAQSVGERKRQEDAYGVSLRTEATEPYLAVVADGMGGAAGGNIASDLAVRTFIAAYEADPPKYPHDTPVHLRKALEKANAALVAEVDRKPELDGMGTTLVAVVDSGEGLFHISVGDSLLWSVEGDRLRQINEDHSMRGAFAQLVAAGQMSAEAAARHPHRNRLRSALGEPDLDMVDCPDTPIELAPDGMLILASDGVETLNPEEIARLVRETDGDAARAVDTMLGLIAAKQQPKQDNSTVCVWRPSAAGTAAPRKKRGLTYTEMAAGVVGIGLAVIGGVWLADLISVDSESITNQSVAKTVSSVDAPPPRATQPSPHVVEEPAPADAPDIGADPDKPAPEPKVLAPPGHRSIVSPSGPLGVPTPQTTVSPAVAPPASDSPAATSPNTGSAGGPAAPAQQADTSDAPAPVASAPPLAAKPVPENDVVLKAKASDEKCTSEMKRQKPLPAACKRNSKKTDRNKSTGGKH